MIFCLLPPILMHLQDESGSIFSVSPSRQLQTEVRSQPSPLPPQAEQILFSEPLLLLAQSSRPLTTFTPGCQHLSCTEHLKTQHSAPDAAWQLLNRGTSLFPRIHSHQQSLGHGRPSSLQEFTADAPEILFIKLFSSPPAFSQASGGDNMELSYARCRTSTLLSWNFRRLLSAHFCPGPAKQQPGPQEYQPLSLIRLRSVFIRFFIQFLS